MAVTDREFVELRTSVELRLEAIEAELAEIVARLDRGAEKFQTAETRDAVAAAERRFAMRIGWAVIGLAGAVGTAAMTYLPGLAAWALDHLSRGKSP